MPLKILISGAGVAGPSLSLFLLRANPLHHVTIIERSPTLRKGGQQIDLRGQGIPVMQKLGLLNAIKARAVAEDGIAFVDARSGKRWAVFGKNDSGKGRQAFTSEYEIMRGDLVDVIYQATLQQARIARAQGGLTYKFGTYATDIQQFEDGVSVTLSDGKVERFDLVVGADGQSSKTRRLAFGQDLSSEVFEFSGVNFAFFSMPGDRNDTPTAQACLVPNRRFMSIRTGGRPSAQGYLGIMGNASSWRGLTAGTIDMQKQLWAETFKNTGWQSERLIRGLLNTDDFYAQRLGQIKMKSWSQGRVTLLGDAAYCPSPMSGMGTACGIVGAYVLAGEITRHEHGNNLSAALQSYEKILRPFISEAQKLPLSGPGMIYLKSPWSVWTANRLLGALSFLRINEMVNRLMPEDKGGWKVPDYPELNLGE
ncbi:oxidoreductase [Colletotrichum chrysophilum]|uniref:Oxidoreductase n=1 Tax=Colletotrichum chrysophilum TaxID=1836956 RepID=A0AAD9EJD1_9PEZI|nr:oxidoreductase [Colletotrichum chrysophilum]